MFIEIDTFNLYLSIDSKSQELLYEKSDDEGGDKGISKDDGYSERLLAKQIYSAAIEEAVKSHAINCLGTEEAQRE